MRKKLILIHELCKLERDMLSFFLISQTRHLTKYAASNLKRKLVRELKLFWHSGIKPEFKIPELLLKPNLNVRKVEMMSNGVILYDSKYVRIENVFFIISYQDFVPFDTEVETHKEVN